MAKSRIKPVKTKRRVSRNLDECLATGGCRVDACATSPTGCAVGLPKRGHIVLQPSWGFTYTSPSYGPQKDKKGVAQPGKLNKAMCPARKGCPVQLVWVEGRPHLRFCRTQPRPHEGPVTGQKLVARNRISQAARRDYANAFDQGRRPGDPGFLVPVSDPTSANDLAREACKCWKSAPDGFSEVVRRFKKAKEGEQGEPVDEKVWRGSFETCNMVNKAALGRLQARRKRVR